MIFSYLSLGVAILSTALGQFFYKKFSLRKKYKYYIIAIVLFLLAPIFSFIALQNISIDIVYMFTSLTILLVLLFSRFFLKEDIDLKTYYGILSIIIGVIAYGI